MRWTDGRLIGEDGRCSTPSLHQTGPIGPDMPASLLQKHPSTVLFLDTASASQL